LIETKTATQENVIVQQSVLPRLIGFAIFWSKLSELCSDLLINCFFSI